MYIAILGRQPALGIAELERVYGSENVDWFSESTATIKSDSFSIEHLGGTQKAGKVILELPRGDFRQASMKIVQHYTKKWGQGTGKITLGLSTYGFSVSSREVQKTGIILKQKLKNSGRSLRLIPNTEPALNTAVSHHNKLGLGENKIELLIVRAKDGRVIVAESIGAQNITALARRDQGRPKRDAFVGMLPPKLGQIIINLATPDDIASATRLSTHAPQRRMPTPADSLYSAELPKGQTSSNSQEPAGVASGLRHSGPSSQDSSALRLLDPFCGTGVILQEAALMGYSVYGTDLSEKMIEYSEKNLHWLQETSRLSISSTLHQGDATTTTWKQPIHTVACESYLGQPFSAPPSPAKLAEVRGNCNHIISSFLKNIAKQLAPGTPLCVAVPAWKDANGTFTHLTLTSQLEKLGYTQIPFKNTHPRDLLYHREDQVVARELLVVVKA